MGTPTMPGVYDKEEFLEVHARDFGEDSPYSEMLRQTEANWERIAARFPSIRQWEVGNEWNFPLFLHPVGWKAGDSAYSIEEMMEIACDLMYVSARGIRRGNPEAKVVCFSKASENGIFTNESEGKFGIVREAHHNYEYREKAKALRKVYRGE